MCYKFFLLTSHLHLNNSVKGQGRNEKIRGGEKIFLLAVVTLKLMFEPSSYFDKGSTAASSHVCISPNHIQASPPSLISR